MVRTGRPLTKAAISSGVSLSTETRDRVEAYHQRLVKAVWAYSRKHVSRSAAVELAIRAGLDILEEMGDERVAAIVDRMEPVPKAVIKRKSKQLARTLGDLTETEVKALTGK